MASRPLCRKSYESEAVSVYPPFQRITDSVILPKKKMGRHFGDLARIRHIITYSLSPFEQKAFANYFSKGIPNVWRRFSSQVFKVAPPFIVTYVTYTWGNHVHQQGKRKVAADYENDV
ncbi:cytochrome b-c1 complex subunit 8-like [Huso huso]|uniref:Cytochrome b-c1 complex subunit 8 n=1 Tax=Huso huso TaxID=61971 RepID=A0ABR0YT85_HUSHU